jgi:PIN domain nuclease of toxin-antitoxin system
LSLLFDSNSLLWWLADIRLPSDLLERIARESPMFVSLVTPWELWIKAESGRLKLPASFESGLTSEDALTVLSPTLDDARLAARLPLTHRDPFDRMIIAQAMNRQLTVITGDRRFRDYGVDIILV